MAVEDYDPIIQAAAREWNVDPTLIKAHMQHESGGNPLGKDGKPIRGADGEHGLMQVMPATGRELGITDPDNIVQNIYGGTKYISQNLDRFPGNVPLAIAAYNAGPDRVATGSIPNTTRNVYVPSVTAHYQRFAKEIGAPLVPRSGEAPMPPSMAQPPVAAGDRPMDADAVASRAALRASGIPLPPEPQAASPTPVSVASAAPPAAETAPDVADFLKKTGAARPDAPAPSAGSAQPAGEDIAAFLKRTGAVEPTPPPEPSTSLAAPVGGEFGDLAAQPWAQGPPADPTARAPVAKIADAAVQGWKDTPSILTPGAQSWVDRNMGVVGQTLLNPGLKLVGAIPAAINAGTAGAFEAAGQTIGLKGARDLLALGASAPMAAGERMSPNVAQAAPEPPGRPQFVSERLAPPDTVGLTPLHRINQLIAYDNAENPPVSGAADRGAPNQFLTTPPDVANRLAPQDALRLPAPDGVDPYSPETAADGGTRSVGAAASRDMTAPADLLMSPGEVKANRRQAELNTILAPAEAGDTTIHVPGSLPTRAEYSGDPAVSQAETMLRQRNPNAFEGPSGRLTANNQARVTALEDITPSDPELNRWREERSARAKQNSDAILQTAGPVDGAPVKAALENVLNDTRNQNRDSVQKNLAPYMDRLQNKDGSLKTDPAAWWGIRDDLTEKLDKIGNDPQSTMGYVKKETLQFRNAIDDALNQATGDKYQKFLDDYAQDSQKINAGKLLFDARSGLTNPKGDLYANKFHKMVTDLAKSRGEAGIDPSMDIPDDVMQRLIAIDTDLKRAGQIDLGKARGSPTNLYGSLAKNLAIGAAHVGTFVTNPTGTTNLLLQGVKNAGDKIIGNARLNYLTNKHLKPPKEGYNRLDPNQ